MAIAMKLSVPKPVNLPSMKKVRLGPTGTSPMMACPNQLFP